MNEKTLRQLDEVKQILDKDLLAADLKVSIFMSAALSFKQDSLLTPFPKSYQNDKEKDFDKLTADLNKIPNLEEFLVLIMTENTSVIPNSVIQILHWIFFYDNTPKYNLASVPRSKYEEVFALSNNKGKITKPSHVFEVTYGWDSAAETRFQDLKSAFNEPTKYAFHGTKFFNIYPILNYGLQQHLNKTGLFGEGLYFSEEFEVSAMFSPSVTGWSKSKCWENISCVALCEYINDPNHVKKRKENAKNSDIPQSYLLITNNELVRVRYLLIYGHKKTPSSKSLTTSAVSEEVPRMSFMAWCRKNPLIVSAVLYVLLLLLVGLSKHRVVDYYKNLVMDFLTNRFKFL